MEPPEVEASTRDGVFDVCRRGGPCQDSAADAVRVMSRAPEVFASTGSVVVADPMGAAVGVGDEVFGRSTDADGFRPKF